MVVYLNRRLIYCRAICSNIPDGIDPMYLRVYCTLNLVINGIFVL